MLLLDTHAYIWLASDQSQLTPAGLEAIRGSAGTLFVSSISALETALLVKRGRLQLPCAPLLFYRRALEQHHLHEVAVDHEVAFQSADLPDIHNDPFDRLLVATALVRQMTILSRDAILPRYPGVRVVW